MSSGTIGSLSQAAPSLLQARETGMLQQLNSGEKTNDKARIEKAAQDFEAMLLGTWMKEAEQSFATVSGSDDDDATKGQMMSLGVQTLSRAMAASGGIGIGKMIAAAMEADAQKQQSAQAGAAAAPKGDGIGQKI